MKSEIRSGADVGRAIRAVRDARGLSQSRAAELVGIDATYLSKIERGRTVSLLEHQLRILRRLGAKVTVTFDDTSVRPVEDLETDAADGAGDRDG